MQFCDICHSIIQDGTCTNRRCTTRNEALSSWLIDGVLWRFKVPLTLAEAKHAIYAKPDIIVKYKQKVPSGK